MREERQQPRAVIVGIGIGEVARLEVVRQTRQPARVRGEIDQADWPPPSRWYHRAARQQFDHQLIESHLPIGHHARQRDRSERLGDRADLEEAVRVERRTARTASVRDDPRSWAWSSGGSAGAPDGVRVDQRDHDPRRVTRIDASAERR